MLAEKDTLEFQKNTRPGAQYLDRSGSRLFDVVTAMNAYMEDAEEVYPEHDAIRFYLTNHAMALVAQRKKPDEPLGDHFVIPDTYHKSLSKDAVRMFYYLLLICTRESRHVHDSSSNWLTWSTKYGDKCVDFNKKIRNSGSGSAAKALRDDPPDVSIGLYTKYLEEVFFKGGFGGGYGGKAWGAVAKVLRQFVWGELSAELMMDTAFTLCHNNGPIFNKGMLYHSYNSSEIVKILDVQRSGQIPQLVANKESQFVTKEHLELGETITELLGDEFCGHVDWFVVEQLGSMGTYHHEKNQQEEMYGKSEAAEKAAQVALEIKAKQTAAKQAEDLKKAQAAELEAKQWYKITPYMKFKKEKMIRFTG